ncbi:hypothetical protein HDV01_002017 [Terramyces sp. JEL0728]|nr:hypothetical protein HDV01_002017 [Terramyces sp. JEL0728]
MSLANQLNQPEANDSKENKDETSTKGESLDTSELERLKKMESRFVGEPLLISELARAYKALKSKYDQVENIITQNSSITELKLPNDFADLEIMVKSSQQSFEADKEIKKLLNQINEMKESYEKEADTNADMYSAIQSKLVSREEEINKLKHKLSKTDGISTPTEDNSGISTPPSTDPITLKLKIRELASALKNVTEQRNSAVEKLKTVETNGGMSSASSQDSLPDKIDLSSQLEVENGNLKMKINTQLNTITALKSKIQTMSAEYETAIQNSKKLTAAKKTDDETIAGLRSQASAMVDDLAELTDESEKLKEKIVSLNKQLREVSSSGVELEQVRQESRERFAALEHRLRTVQQKLETSEKSNAELLNELTIHGSQDNNEEIKDRLEKANGKVQELSAELHKHKLEKETIEKDFQSAKTSIDKLKTTISEKEKSIETLKTKYKLQISKSTEEYSQAKKDLLLKSGQLQELQSHEAKLESNISNLENKAKLLKERLSRSEKHETELIQLNLELKEKLDFTQSESISKSSNAKKEIISLKEKLKREYELGEVYRSKLRNLLSTFPGLNQLVLQLEEMASAATKNEEMRDNLDVGNIQKVCDLLVELGSIGDEVGIEHLKEDLEDTPDDVTVTNGDAEFLQKLQELNQEIRATKALNMDLQSRFSTLTLELNEQTEQLKSQIGLKTKAECDLKVLEEKLAEFTLVNSDLVNINEELTKELDLLASRDNIQTEPQFNSDEIDNLKSQINQLEDSCSEKERKIAELSEKNGDLLSDEQIKDLRGKLQAVEENSKSLEEQIVNVQNELADTQKKLTLEEEKKTKSIQLLRNSKNRIIKLENDVQIKTDEAKKLQDDLEIKVKTLESKEKALKEKDSQVSGLLLQKEELENRLQKMHALNLEIDALKNELASEQKKFALAEEGKVKFLEETKHEYAIKLQQNSQSQLENEEGMKNEMKQFKNEIEQLQSNLTAADNRIENIDAELATSKSLFEMKCIENDNLKLSISEMEVKYFECSQEQLKLTEESSVMKNAVILGQKKIEELQNELQDNEQRQSAASRMLADLEIQLQRLEQEKKEGEAKLLNMEKMKNDNQREDQELIQQSALLTTLKEEVKKLSRPGSSASSVVSSPRLSRAGSHDIPPPMKYSPPAVSPTRNSINGTKQLHLEPEYLKNVVLKLLESNKRVLKWLI